MPRLAGATKLPGAGIAGLSVTYELACAGRSGVLHRLSAVCPHLKCIVPWNPAERTFDCPCHGSRFDAIGAVISGPANRNLDPA